MTQETLRLGRRIARIRRKREITQEQLAERVNVSTSWISQIERGVEVPNLKMLHKLARALECKVKDFL